MNSQQHKIKIQTIKFGYYNIYLIRTETGYILVDTGMPKLNQKLDEAFQNFGVDPKSIQIIILTHGHLDHIGSIAYLQQLTGAKVLCHRSLANELAVGKSEPAVPQNFLGRFLNFMTGILGSKIEAVNPNIQVDDEFDLNQFGISGKVIHTPGHSPSSISVVLESGEALVGDMIREEKAGQIGLGMFYENKATAIESLKKVAAYNPQIIYLSHNDTIDNQTLNEFILAQV